MNPRGVGIALAALVAAVALVPAPAGARGDAPTAAELRIGGEGSTSPDVVIAEDGSMVAIWSRTTANAGTRIQSSVRSSGTSSPFGPAQDLAQWDPPRRAGIAGHPQVVDGDAGTVLAVWVSSRFRLVTARWDPADGWGQPSALTPKGTPAFAPYLTASAADLPAMSWREVAPDGRVDLHVGVLREDGWFAHRVGRVAHGGWEQQASPVGIDDAGNATVAWHDIRGADAVTYARRLPAGSTTWEEPERFAVIREIDDCGCELGLTVDGGGTAYLSDVAPPIGGGGPKVRVRADDGPWLQDDRIPFVAMAQQFEFNDLGEGMTHDDHSVFTRQEDGTWTGDELFPDTRLDQIVLDEGGRAAAVDLRPHVVVFRVRMTCGTWMTDQKLGTRAGIHHRYDDLGHGLRAALDDGVGPILWRTRSTTDPDSRWALNAHLFNAVPPVC